jgi:hypothetical protein
MADDETKQLIRELLAAEMELLELARRNTETYEQYLVAAQKQNEELILKNTERYEIQAQAYDRLVARSDQYPGVNKIANLIRALTFLVMAGVLVYLVLFGLHRH